MGTAKLTGEGFPRRPGLSNLLIQLCVVSCCASNALTFEETNLLCIYSPGSRLGAIEALSEMRGHLEPDETELLALTDSTLAKLRAMADAEFDGLELYPDFVD